MNNQEIIKAVADLDGWVFKGFTTRIGYPNKSKTGFAQPKAAGEQRIRPYELPDYLNSRDAIVPVIEKCCSGTTTTWFAFSEGLVKMGRPYIIEPFVGFIKATPRQLCEALLRATGKWK